MEKRDNNFKVYPVLQAAAIDTAVAMGYFNLWTTNMHIQSQSANYLSTSLYIIVHCSWCIMHQGI